MNQGKYVFAQIMEHMPLSTFRRCVDRYRGHYKVQRFSCLDQFLCMAFAQLTYRESLRDIEICFESPEPKLYHAGFRGNIARNTLAKANQTRDWRIYADFAQILIGTRAKLYAGDLGVELEQTVYALDSTTIDLCLALFPWAQFRTHQGSRQAAHPDRPARQHPRFIHISGGKMHDVKALDHSPGTRRLLRHGPRLHRFRPPLRLSTELAFFVTRAKKNLQYRASQRPVDTNTGLRCDQTIVLTGTKTRQLSRSPAAGQVSTIPRPASAWSFSPTTSCCPR